MAEVVVDVLRRVAAALDIRIDLVARWRGGDLNRLLNARHSALHEELAQMFDDLPEWIAQPEVSFSIYGERGVIDVLAWHPTKRALLVIEIKTDIADINELLGTVDRKNRLSRRIAAERGWDPVTIGVWLVVASGPTNRRRVAAHRAVFRGVLPDDSVRLRSWLRDPVGSCRAVSFWGPYSRGLYTPGRRQHARGSNARRVSTVSEFAARRRVRVSNRTFPSVECRRIRMEAPPPGANVLATFI